MATLLTPNILASQGDPFSKTDQIPSSHLLDQRVTVVLAEGDLAQADYHELPGHIYVRDPPNGGFLQQAPRIEFSILAPNIYSPADSLALDAFSPSPVTTTPSPESLTHHLTPMAKKRRSLQSIFVPSFLHSPIASPPSTPSSRARSHSSGSDWIYHPPLDNDASSRPDPSSASPPPFPLDDDPFARLESPAVSPSFDADIPPRPTFSAPTTPRSPLSPSTTELATRLSPPFRSSPASLSVFPRSHLIHPAHKRPAFAPRPSLPTLHTLAQMNVILPRKARRGKVGASLPYEPWDIPTEPISDRGDAIPGPSSARISGASAADFTSELDMDFLDFSDDHDIDEDDDDYFDDSTVEVRQSTFDAHPSGPQQTRSELFQAEDLDPLSRLSSATEPSLSRTPSCTSISSSSSLSDAEEYDGPLSCADSSRRSNDSQHSTSSQPHSSSAESDSDIPRSPPDDGYFDFPRSTSPDNELDDNDGDYARQDDLDMPFHGLDHTPHHSIYFHRSNSLGMGNTESTFEPGSSAGTVRGSLIHGWAMSRNRRSSNKWANSEVGEEVVDGSDWHTTQNGHYYSSNHGGNNGFGRSYGGGGYSGQTSNGRGNGGASGGDDGDDRRGRRGRETFDYKQPFPSDSEEDESESEDDYGLPSASTSKKAGPDEYSASDDDVPLAKRIPTALTAQKSIRKKVREERDQRRKDRAAKAAQLQSAQPRSPLTPDSPAYQQPMSSSQETPMQTSRSGRKRTMTMPSNTARPFAIEELRQKLTAVELPKLPMRSKSRSRRPSDDEEHNPQPLPEMPTRSARARSRPPSPKHMADQPPRSARSRSRPPSPDRSVPNGQSFQDTSRTLRPMRSFHKHNDTRVAVDHSIPLPIPVDAKHGLARSKTDARARRRLDAPVDHGIKSKSLNMQGADTSDIDQMMRGRKPADGQANGQLTVQRRDPSRSRPSVDRDTLPAPRKSLQRQTPSPVPPLPLPEVKAQVLTQQRIFIGDMQSFNTIEISTNTTAQDVLDMVQAQGSLKHFVGSGGWMLFEVAQDFGMERPVRSFELLADVQASWNKDKMVNTFVIKMTPFSSVLSRSNIPSSSPMHSGWVEYEVKRGKWNKRWMQLREHSLWLSKRDSGKDEVFLCSLSNFDAYSVTRVHKAPKPYVFSTKSTDNITFFENAADYLHVFSCPQKDGEKWMEVILLARSYVLYQEKNVLFNPKAAPSLPVSSGLNRSGTRKNPSGRPSQPLVEVASQDVFAPGSLLYRKS